MGVVLKRERNCSFKEKPNLSFPLRQPSFLYLKRKEEAKPEAQAQARPCLSKQGGSCLLSHLSPAALGPPRGPHLPHRTSGPGRRGQPWPRAWEAQRGSALLPSRAAPRHRRDPLPRARSPPMFSATSPERGRETKPVPLLFPKHLCLAVFSPSNAKKNRLKTRVTGQSCCRNGIGTQLQGALGVRGNNPKGFN